MVGQWDNRSPEDPAENGFIDFLGTSDLFDIKPATEVMPEWLKQMSSRVSVDTENVSNLEVFTLKKCIPFLDAMTTGYMVVCKKDIDIESSFGVTTHPIKQIGEMPISGEFKNVAYKWMNSITIKTPEGYSCLFMHPANYPSIPFYTLSGVVDTDTYFQPVNFPFLLKTGTTTIKAGTPIAQVFPFKRDDWSSRKMVPQGETFKSETALVTRMYHDNRLDNLGRLVGGLYKRFYRHKKRYL